MGDLLPLIGVIDLPRTPLISQQSGVLLCFRRHSSNVHALTIDSAGVSVIIHA